PRSVSTERRQNQCGADTSANTGEMPAWLKNQLAFIAGVAGGYLIVTGVAALARTAVGTAGSALSSRANIAVGTVATASGAAGRGYWGAAGLATGLGIGLITLIVPGVGIASAIGITAGFIAGAVVNYSDQAESRYRERHPSQGQQSSAPCQRQ